MPDLINFKDLAQDNAEQVIEDKRRTLSEYIDRVVMKEPAGPARWKAAKRMAIELGFSGTPGLTAYEENALVEKENAKDRYFNYLHNKGYDKSDDSNSDLRGALNMPYYVNMFIKLVDPTAFNKENFKAVLKTFPEYHISEKV